jgi:hypothetical protein
MRPRSALCLWRRARASRLSLFMVMIVTAVTAIVAAQALATTGLGVKITARPRAISRSSAAVFRWRTSGHVLHVRCSLDGRRFTACGRARRYIRLRNGRHSFRVEVLSSGRARRMATVR